jgi:asparagine synthase (glutamine-hydrolysing)
MLGGLNYKWLDNPEVGLAVPYMDVWSKKGLSFLQKMSAFDIKTYLNGDINTKVDRATMAFAIEARAPLMDYRVISFAQQLPADFKFKTHNQKRILKDILYRHIPSQYFDRPKRGFSLPIRHWFRNELKEYVLDELSVSSLKDIPGVNVAEVVSMIQEHMSGKYNRSVQIWKLLVFKQWQQNQHFQLSIPD